MNWQDLGKPLSIHQIDLNHCFDLRDGALVWKERPLHHFKNARGMNSFNKRFAGKVAGSLHKPSGYLHVDIFGGKWKAHRIIWKMCHGEWPDHIDHVNGDKTDNRIENLRNVSHSENMQNKPRPRTNKSGVCGVHWLKSAAAWVAYATSGGSRYHLGKFDCWFDAVCARKSAEARLGFHKNHGRTYGS